MTALNPKSIAFFVAFLPQFLDLAAPVAPQMMIFEATFLPLAALNALGYALLAAARAADHPPAGGAAGGQPHRRLDPDRRRALHRAVAARRRLKRKRPATRAGLPSVRVEDRLQR